MGGFAVGLGRYYQLSVVLVVLVVIISSGIYSNSVICTGITIANL